jgi:hypothetical protein
LTGKVTIPCLKMTCAARSYFSSMDSVGIIFTSISRDILQKGILSKIYIIIK